VKVVVQLLSSEPAPDLGGGAEAAPELAPESKKMNDLNLILEDDMINGLDTLDLSKGKKSLSEIDDKLGELLK
jgi:hypothetical protein